MDSFWSKLLILGIVAAIGLFFIHNVYTPQRSAQEAMADSTQQSVNAVKAGVSDTGPTIVNSEDVVNTIRLSCTTGNTTKYTVVNESGNSYEFTTSSTTTGNNSVTNVVVSNKFYTKTGSIATGTITFKEM